MSLWSEYVTTTNFHVGKKKFAVPAKISAELQNLSFLIRNKKTPVGGGGSDGDGDGLKSE